jgi:hypothetical protein
MQNIVTLRQGEKQNQQQTSTKTDMKWMENQTKTIIKMFLANR